MQKSLLLIEFLCLFLIQTSEQFPSNAVGKARNRRSVIMKDDKYRWPDNTILYTIATNNPSRLSGLEIVIAEFEARTCIKFQKVSRSDSRYKIVLTDVPNTGCYTFPGWLRAGHPSLKEKELNLGTNCDTLGTIRHELQHVMGVMHMQSAWDRDSFIKFHKENVKDPNNISQFDIFKKEQSSYMGGRYDFRSTMHYGSTSGAKEGTETMIGLKASNHFMIDHRDNPRLSFFDLNTINKAYKCAAKCPSQSCSGYMDKSCKCIQPTDAIFGGSVNNPTWPPSAKPDFIPAMDPQVVMKVQAGQLPVVRVKSDIPGQSFQPNHGKSFQACKNTATVYYEKQSKQFLVALKSSRPAAGCYIGNRYLDPNQTYRPMSVIGIADVYKRIWLIFYLDNFKPTVVME